MAMNPIFVVGMPRSGTTMLQSRLHASPEAYSLPETHFFGGILPRLEKGGTEPLSVDDLDQVLLLLHKYMDLDLQGDRRQGLHTLAAAGRLTGQALFEFLLEQYRPDGDGARAQRPVEKTPLHVLHMSKIRALYPSARFVHIVRDPRNAISSMLRTPFTPTTCLAWLAQLWNLVLRLATKSQPLASGDILTIRYEDLVQEPEVTLRQVCAFAGLAYDRAMIEPAAAESAHVYLPKETWKTSVQSGGLYFEPDAWRSRLGQGQAWLIERYTRQGMETWGYLPQAKPAFAQKLQARREIWRQIRQEPSTLALCLALARQCDEAGDRWGAARLAREIVCSDPRRLRDSRIRQWLL